ncbi:LOW QUALITY PROTEIN: catechol O-methyltransferase B [Pseudochaenichthys georgianus]|uniref:LOW QUALITY PROTEIN: catechol O-methyltransferase B n=1 Tax=Pseudochaenichthys georgianus TaxID=52239 RepID=UPI00146B4823|nr:LOW QUALITY PROTEIN: catechol O-methyltransferase B [Pseudochaenichthys georgianus]
MPRDPRACVCVCESSCSQQITERGMEGRRREELVSNEGRHMSASQKPHIFSSHGERRTEKTGSAACPHMMWLTLLYSITGGAALLYALYRWLIPAVVQYHAGLALIWHDVIVERILDTVTQSTRHQRILGAVQKNATRGDPRSVVRAIDQYCRNQEWAMNVGDEKGCILDSVVSEVNPATVLELGTYCGYSTVRIASLLPPHAKLITLELNPEFAVIARQVIAWAGLEDKIQLVEGASGDLIPKMKEQFGVETFDLVFLDHWKDRYLPDTKLMEECGLLRKGSVLLADNVICPGTPDYLEFVRSSPRYESQYFKSHLEYTKVEDGLEKSVFLG